MAKLQSLLNHCKFFMKCVFVLSFYNALYCRFMYAPLRRVFANQVTYFIVGFDFGTYMLQSCHMHSNTDMHFLCISCNSMMS